VIDLSFTQNPEWIKQRETLWKPIGKDFATELSKKEYAPVQHYFMTGEFLNGERFEGDSSDLASFVWFPLQTPEAWDYLFEHRVLGSAVFEELFYFSFEPLWDYALTPDEELALWDYFLPLTFQPKVRSRVPVGEKKEYIEFNVDPFKVVSPIIPYLTSEIRKQKKNEVDKYYRRLDYFLSCLPNLEFCEKKTYTGGDIEFRVIKRIRHMATRIYHKNIPDWFSSDPLRQSFLDRVVDEFENNDALAVELKNAWNEGKKG